MTNPSQDIRRKTRRGNDVRRAVLATERRVAGLRTRTVRVDGFDVVFEDRPRARAEQPPVLMLHGFSSDRDVWTRFATRLRGRRVIIPDLPGHGATGFRAGAGYSAPAQAARVLALLDLAGVEQVHVIGNSMGGFVAAHLTLLAPERVASLGLVDSAGVDPTRANKMADLLEAGRNPFLIDDPRDFAAFYAMTMARPPFVPELVKRAVAAEYVERREQLTEIFGDFHDHDVLQERLPELDVPTWVAWGRKDQIIDVTAARVFDDGLPRSILTTYADLGHMPMFEAPKRVARDYEIFLRSVSRGALAPTAEASAG